MRAFSYASKGRWKDLLSLSDAEIQRTILKKKTIDLLGGDLLELGPKTSVLDLAAYTAARYGLDPKVLDLLEGRGAKPSNRELLSQAALLTKDENLLKKLAFYLGHRLDKVETDEKPAVKTLRLLPKFFVNSSEFIDQTPLTPLEEALKKDLEEGQISLLSALQLIKEQEGSTEFFLEALKESDHPLLEDLSKLYSKSIENFEKLSFREKKRLRSSLIALKNWEVLKKVFFPAGLLGSEIAFLIDEKKASFLKEIPTEEILGALYQKGQPTQRLPWLHSLLSGRKIKGLKKFLVENLYLKIENLKDLEALEKFLEDVKEPVFSQRTVEKAKSLLKEDLLDWSLRTRILTKDLLLYKESLNKERLRKYLKLVPAEELDLATLVSEGLIKLQDLNLDINKETYHRKFGKAPLFLSKEISSVEDLEELHQAGAHLNFFFSKIVYSLAEKPDLLEKYVKNYTDRTLSDASAVLLGYNQIKGAVFLAQKGYVDFEELFRVFKSAQEVYKALSEDIQKEYLSYAEAKLKQEAPAMAFTALWEEVAELYKDLLEDKKWLVNTLLEKFHRSPYPRSHGSRKFIEENARLIESKTYKRALKLVKDKAFVCSLGYKVSLSLDTAGLSPTVLEEIRDIDPVFYDSLKKGKTPKWFSQLSVKRRF